MRQWGRNLQFLFFAIFVLAIALLTLYLAGVLPSPVHEALSEVLSSGIFLSSVAVVLGAMVAASFAIWRHHS